MRISFLVLCGLLMFQVIATTQTRTFFITDADGGAPLYMAYVQNLQSGETRSADDQGLAYLYVEDGDSVRISYVGYHDTSLMVQDNKNYYEVALQVRPLKEIVILSEEPFNRQAALGRQHVSMEFLTAIPSLTGDADILKTLTFLPGVTGGREGYSHMMVRGGEQDQNLILLDGATLFNVNHFGGFISMFHSEMIGSVDFYKSFWPSQFGGRLSSVLDLRSAPGNYQDHKQIFDLGIIYSKAKLTGPLWKHKVSYSIGARRTFIDLITGPIIHNTRQGKRIGEVPNIAVGDANARVDVRIADNQHLALTGFYGRDKVELYTNTYDSSSDEKYTIRNGALTLNYSWHLNEISNYRVHASMSTYQHAFEDDKYDNYRIHGNPNYTEADIFQRNSGNNIRSLKMGIYGFQQINKSLELSYGTELEQLDYNLFLDRSQQYQFKEEISTVDSFSGTADRLGARTMALFGDATYRISDRWKVKAGLRSPWYKYDDYGKFLPEPKALVIFELDPQSTFNFAFNLQQQSTILLGYTTQEAYFREFYTTADAMSPPSISYQWSMGYFAGFNNDPEALSSTRWIDNLSVEVFYKKQKDLVRFIPSTDEDQNVLNYEHFLHQDGVSTTYGAEFLAQKTAGKFHATVSYTYAHSRVRFANMNRGQSFDSDFDFRHNASILLMYMWGKGYKIAAGWNYRTGRPFTLPNSYSPSTDLSGGYPLLTDINNYRMPAYHRLDINLDREYLTNRGKKQWFGLSIYNVYNRINPFSISSDDNGNLKVHGFLPIIPSVHFGFEL